MKIGVIGTIWINTPPRSYGGTESVIYNLVNGLTDLGHDVTLFAPASTRVKAHLIPTVDKPLREKNIPWTNVAYTFSHITEAFDHAKEFDVLHMHLNQPQDFIALALAAACPTPVVFTIHFDIPSSDTRPDKYSFLKQYRHLPFISISNTQRDSIPLRFIKTVYHGLAIEEFPYVEKPKDYVLWLGRIHKDKGTREAILAAKKAGVQIKIAGDVNDDLPGTIQYFKRRVKPLIDGKQVVHLGFVDKEEKAKLFGNAKAFLNPIQWEEPFGLVMIEALATGTPVISYKRGAAKEIIQNKKNGFFVKSVAEMAKKIATIDTISRQACRQTIEKNFTAAVMAKNYIDAYRTAIEHWDRYIYEEKKSLEKDYPLLSTAHFKNS